MYVGRGERTDCLISWRRRFFRGFRWVGLINGVLFVFTNDENEHNSHASIMIGIQAVSRSVFSRYIYYYCWCYSFTIPHVYIKG